MNLKNITFVTGNSDKIGYAQKFLNFPIQHQDIDLEEIQSTDAYKVVEHKVRQAYDIIQQPVMVEDASLVFKALKTLPGPFVKWFYEELGNQGLCDMLNGYEDRSASTSVIYAMFDGEEYLFFESILFGYITYIPGKDGVGYNPIFIPEGYDKPLSEISPEKIQIRKKAFQDINQYFINNNH